jgi:GntR family transcriptional repressor for pyruvate dehydrogenase complex
VRSGPSSGGRAAVFAPLPAGRRADAVVRRLSEGIRLGLLVPDEQLPSESDLADSFGVSAVTVREALTALRGQGLVITRRGRNGGSFVRDVPGGASAVLRERLREVSPSELRDLADHYVALSGTSALLAADRAGKQDIALIADGVAALERAVDADARRRAESRFHVELAAAAQSPRLTRAVIGMQAEVGPLLWLSAGTHAAQQDVLGKLRDVLAAVAAGDGPRARAVAGAHVYAALARASALQLTLLGEDPGGRVVTEPVGRLVDRVSRLCESTFAAVDGLRGVAEQLFLRASDGEPLRRADIEQIATVVRPVLEAEGTPLVGAGLVLAPGALADAEHWMEWWHRGPGGDAGVRRLRPVLDPAVENFYDYTVLPWFVIPRETGARHVTGPYVDRLCTEEYTLTFTVPLHVSHPGRGREYLGVVGADIVNSWLERRLLPLLHRVGQPAALVNAEGRVVVANEPSLVAGAVTHSTDVPALWSGRTGEGAVLHRLDGLPLGILVLDPGGR